MNRAWYVKSISMVLLLESLFVVGGRHPPLPLHRCCLDSRFGLIPHRRPKEENTLRVSKVSFGLEDPARGGINFLPKNEI